MSIKFKLATAVALVGLTGASAMAQVTVSTAKDQKSVALTVYNGDFAVVRETRALTLKKGLNAVRFEDVAAQIDPTSISIKSLTAPRDLRVLEQNYQYDLINPMSILAKSVGKTLRLRQLAPNGSVSWLEGTLLAPPASVVADTEGRAGMVYQGLVMRLTDGRLILNPSGEITLAELPDGLIASPSLLWKLHSEAGSTREVEASYMANRINWKVDYVAVISQDESKLDLTGWVTLDNRSGATYKNASLQLMAGDVRRVQPDRPRMMAAPSMMEDSMQMAKGGGFQEESFFEYHLYTLQGTTDIRDNETKQMTLLSAPNAAVTRKLVFDAARRSFQPGRGGDTAEGKLAIVLEVVNAETNNMGMPLPKGKVRVYKADASGALQFLGEDLIDHTPREETVRLYIGDAFDVVGERKRTNFTQLGERSNEETWEITIRNRKKEAATVTVTERFWGDWTISNNNLPFTKKDAQTVDFVMTLQPNAEGKVTYTVRRKW